MMGTVILTPAAAAEAVCHDEQLRIWAHEIVAALGMENYLNITSYDDTIDMERIVAHEIRQIIEMAMNHPEAATIRRRS